MTFARERNVGLAWVLGTGFWLVCASSSGVDAAGDLDGYRNDLKGPNKYTRDKTVWLVAREIAPADAVPLLVDVLLRDPEEQVRASAAQALGEIGAPAVSAVPALVRATHDTGEMSFVNDRAVEALSRIGPAAIPQLAEAMCGKYGPAVGRALGQMGSPALPTLTEGLARGECRRGAALGIEVVGTAAAGATPRLVTALADNDAAVRFDVLAALGAIGPPAAAAAPAIVSCLKDPERRVRLQAVVVLGLMGPAARAAIPGLREALNDRDEQVRLNAQLSLSAVEAGPVRQP